MGASFRTLGEVTRTQARHLFTWGWSPGAPSFALTHFPSEMLSPELAGL